MSWRTSRAARSVRQCDGRSASVAARTQQSIGGHRRRGLLIFAHVLLLALPPLELPRLVQPEQERERHQRHRPPSWFESDRSGGIGRSAHDGG